MLKLYYRILISTLKTFGARLIFFRLLLGIPLFLGFTNICLFFDHLFFPNFGKSQVEKPVFIIGNPRSGTSFIHQILNQQGGLGAFDGWHIIFPSLTARVLFKPVVNYLVSCNLSTIVPENIGHQFSLDRIDEEELLFLYKFDTQFLVSDSPLAFDDREYPELRCHDLQPASRRHSSVKFFKGCLQRQIYYTGKKRLVAQVHFSTQRVKTLSEAFPDAKFIYLVRSPYETIPSHLSLVRNSLDYRWGLKNIPPAKLKQWYDRVYHYDVELYSYFYNLQKMQDISQDRILVLKYDLLKSDLENAWNKIAVFLDIQQNEILQQEIQYQAQLQKSYQRKHQVMELEEFGLNREVIYRDLSFIFKEYGF